MPRAHGHLAAGPCSLCKAAGLGCKKPLKTAEKAMAFWVSLRYNVSVHKNAVPGTLRQSGKRGRFHEKKA